MAKKRKSHKRVSTYVERLKKLYKNAKMENMNWTNLLIHQTLNKVHENEAHKDIRKTISSYLSELGSTGIADIPTFSIELKA